MSKAIRRIKAPDILAHALLIKGMIDGRLNNHELAKFCGLNYLTVCRHTAALHQVRAAHVTRFEADARGAFTIRVFKLGKDSDAEAPARPRAQRAREQRWREQVQKPLPKYG